MLKVRVTVNTKLQMHTFDCVSDDIDVLYSRVIGLFTDATSVTFVIIKETK